MEQTKGRRAFCIGLSILIALLVWFYANDDTEIEISVNDVPIEFTNEDTTLADKGLMLLSNEEETIDLKLSMPRSTYFKLDPGKIRIVVDLSSVTTTGTQTITYSVLYPRGPRGELLSSSITQKEPTVRSTTIEIGELFRKNVEHPLQGQSATWRRAISPARSVCCPRRLRCAASRSTSCR